MSLSEHIAWTLELPAMIVRSYLQDLSDDELMIRPGPGMNHIAWQLGHLIVSEHCHIDQLQPGAMPALPQGFAERHTKQTCSSERREDFETKDCYLRLMQQQRQGTLAVLAGMQEDELMAPAPESARYFGPTVGAVISGQAVHWMMHAGQWAVVRRKLGNPPLF